MLKRYLEAPVAAHLKEHRQMVFLVGPRQVGKTTLAKLLVPNPVPGLNYFNWDLAEHRKALLVQVFTGKFDLSGKDKEVMVFDEIHKYPRWKNVIKGLFDKYEPQTHWIITGSAALNVYRKGQDSLLGRAFTYNLCPFSVAELKGKFGLGSGSVEELAAKEFAKPTSNIQDALITLDKFSGFPEPLVKKDMSFLSRWRRTRLERLINQDLAKTESLKNLPLVENLMLLLPERVGNLLSLNSLREDLEVHFATVKHWIELLERVFYGFIIRPYSGRLSRALKKEAKWYLLDWTEVTDPGKRFENLVAVHLMKYVHYINNLGLGDLSLHYVRDKEKREVDFLICRDRKPFLLIECKLSDDMPSNALAHFAKFLKVRRVIQLIFEPAEPRAYLNNGIRIEVVSAASFLHELV